MGLKRIFIVIILVVVTLVLTGCVSRTDTIEERKKYAQLVMPDGTIVEGECTYLCRHSNGWIEIYIDGVEYLTDKWRAVIWKGQ